MTNLEALKGEIEPFSVGNNALVKKLTDNGLDAEDEYILDNKKPLALSAIGILCSMLALSSEAIGKMSSSYNREGIKDKIASLCSENGLDPMSYSNSPRVRIL